VKNCKAKKLFRPDPFLIKAELRNPALPPGTRARQRPLNNAGIATSERAMIRVNVRAGLRDTRRIQSAAHIKLMTIGEFTRFALRRILGRAGKLPPRKPPSSEGLLAKKFRPKRTGSQ